MTQPHHRRSNVEPSQQWLPRHVASVTRRVGVGPHVLRRSVDRLEHIVVLAALVLMFAAIPFAIMVSTTVNRQSQVLSVTETADRTRGTATLLVSVPQSMQLDGAASIVRTAARWRTPAGAVRVGDVPATPGSVAGQSVAIWLNSSGHQVDQPLTSDEAKWQGVMAGVYTMAAVIALLTLVVVILRGRLNRARLSGWAAEWRRVEPRWTNRRS
jgi:hypothetical protein